MKPNVETRLELLKKHYVYHEVDKSFDIVLHYEKVSDILNKQISSISNVPIMNDEFLLNITDILDYIPNGYHVHISLEIDDYEGYKEKTIMESFNDMLEFGRVKYNSNNRKKFFKVALILAIGLVLLSFGIFAGFEEWWHLFDKEEFIGQLLLSFLEIAGWVFCWEAVSIIFLEDNDDMKKGSAVIKKLSSFSLLGKNKEELIEEESEQIYKILVKQTPLQRAGYLFFIFSGFAFMGLASMVAIRLITTMSVSFQALGLGLTLLNWVWIILLFIGGLFAVKIYFGKEKYRLPAGIFALINLIYGVVIIIVSCLNNLDVSLISTNIISIVIESAYCIGFFFTLEYKKSK